MNPVLRPIEERTAACLVIDYDNAAMLDMMSSDPPVNKDLMQRTVCPFTQSHSQLDTKLF